MTVRWDRDISLTGEFLWLYPPYGPCSDRWGAQANPAAKGDKCSNDSVVAVPHISQPFFSKVHHLIEKFSLKAPVIVALLSKFFYSASYSKPLSAMNS
jgi:hypothetical protein